MIRILCWLAGHDWDYYWENGIRICRHCDKIEKIN